MMQSPYDSIGGESGVRALVDAFYDRMNEDPSVSTIRQMHADDLTEARQKFFAFLSGWMGGPNLYVEAYGHPRLRRRHLPFPIDTSASDEWMRCMNHALDQTLDDAELRVWFSERFANVAQHMINQ